MAASANPSQEGQGQGPAALNGHSNRSAGGPAPAVASTTAENSSPAAQALKHNPGISLEWTADELSILEDGLTKYASESNLLRYAKIAMKLKDKTVRDVALRCKWMSKKDNSKRRKTEDHNLSRKSKDKKEKSTDPAKPSQSGARPNVPSYTMQMLPMDNDDGISYKAIGGPTGQLLERNAQVFNQITSNLASFKIQENMSLFCQTRDNILTILNDLNDMPDVMKQMPPLPVKVNEELANSILPPPTLPMQP